jgi:hypothetical protein
MPNRNVKPSDPAERCAARTFPPGDRSSLKGWSCTGKYKVDRLMLAPEGEIHERQKRQAK